jgi:hypothetical protein
MDHLKASVAAGRLHECSFAPARRPLQDFLAQSNEKESEIWDRVARLVASRNLSVDTAASSEVRAVIEHAFHEGYQQGALHGGKGDCALAFHRYCPPCKPTALRKRIIALSAKDTTRQEHLLSDIPFVCMTMDAGQIGPLKIFATNLVASNITHQFTHSITQIDQLDHNKVCDFRKNILSLLQRRHIQIGTIVCDGASYQVKALNFEDLESIQARNPEMPLFARLIYLPCLCHRLNNAYHRLLRDSPFFKGMIRALHDMARFCRKPNQRRALGAVCPEFIKTRWLYDHRLFEFILHHEDAINTIRDSGNPVPETVHDYSPILSILFTLMTQLESSTVPLARAFPLISDALAGLSEHGAHSGNADVREMCERTANLVSTYLLQSTHDLPQLA